MLPSMPVLFARDSQDAHDQKIEPTTSFFGQKILTKQFINPEPPPLNIVKETPKDLQRETKGKGPAKKKEEPPKLDDNALQTALVRSYYTKVQSRFGSNMSVPSNKFVQFQHILKTFDPSKETPVDLYKKIEKLFGEEHKDIVEEFLLFLKPGQAAEVGRFMDHFAIVQMTGFIELLQTTFSRKPTVFRKILRALTTGINSGKSAELKTRVLPHLRSNPRLIKMFKALFPDERPPESAYETGVDVMNESFLTADKGYDVWEFEEENDNKRKLDAKESLDTVYLHGRVFLQHGRLLRSARVTYPYSKEPYRVHARRLAPIHCLLSPSESEEERSSPKRNKTTKIPPKRTKKQLKSPIKNVKDVNDNTKVKEAVTNILNSPKTVKGKSQKTKNCKPYKTELKRDRKDSKNNMLLKKDDGSKAKQSKMVPIHIEIKSAEVKMEPVCTEIKTVEVKSNSWTRDEDKTILQVLKGEATSEQVFGRISELLPHRSSTEIKERFCHVMNLLQQMAVGEVT